MTGQSSHTGRNRGRGISIAEGTVDKRSFVILRICGFFNNDALYYIESFGECRSERDIGASNILLSVLYSSVSYLMKSKELDPKPSRAIIPITR